ncbi:AAA family ATPase [Gordonia sp. TBRC 11910]|uniref:AAA family ATPase n=1 Tax=Gordonia asplenii TaxID=2725283 RepID=A0A848KU74_9ACTN|nr:AAA family ATPase [Gordonia asplenii]NMO01759.1 AAA family ATPase [Gordonia asplenii]
MTALRLAVSGTYSTGKSTLTEALSLATGIPRTHAMTSREILADLIPGKTVMELNSVELLALGLRRFEERVQNESGLDGFISDGSIIHEWVYGQARAETGINPGAPAILRTVKRVAGWRHNHAYRTYLDIYGQISRERAATLYDAFVHLPVEFPLHDDGHRPVSEPFRHLSDTMLYDTVTSLGLPVLTVRGTTEERLSTVLDHYQLPTVLDVGDAIAQASDRVTRAQRRLQDNARVLAAQRNTSLARRIRYAARY